MALALVAVLLAAGLGAAGLIVLSGPIAVGSLARMLEDRLSGERARLTIGSATLELAGGLRAVVELDNVSIEILDGGAEGAAAIPVSVTVPRIVAPIDLRAAVGGRLAVADIRLEQPRLTVRPPADEASEIPAMETLSLAADSVARLALDQLTRRGVERIDLVSAELRVEGSDSYRMRGIDATLTRAAAETLAVDAEVAGRLGRWRIAARRSVDEASGTRLIRVDVDDVTLGEFLPAEADIRTGRGLGVPVDIRVETELDGAGAYRATRLSTVVSPGWVNTGKTIVSFDRIDVQVQWQAGTPGFQIAPSYYLRGNTVIPFEGVVEPPRDWKDRWSFRLLSQGARLGPADVPGPPYEMEQLVVEGDADPDARDVTFSRIALRSGTATLDGAGSVRIAPDGPYIALAFESGPMAVATLKRLWPITLVPPARAWVIEHVLDGRVDGGRATVALSPPAFDMSDPDPGWEEEDVNVEIRLSDVAMKTVGTVPILQGVRGTVTLTDGIVTVQAQEGVVATRPDAPLAVRSATFSIPDVRLEGEKTGVLSLSVAGGAAALADVLDAQPFGLLARQDLAADDMSGRAEVTFDATFPLRKDLDIEAVDWAMSGRLEGFASARPLQGRTVSGADLSFEVDRARLQLTGRGRLDGLPADLDLVIPLDGAGAVAARQDVVVDATAEQLAARGIDLRAFVNGPMRLKIDETTEGQGFDIDLTRARIDLAQVGWAKVAGVPARARFTLSESRGRREIRGFEFTSDGVEIAGALTLDGSGDLVQAQFSRFALRPTDDATLRVSRDGRRFVADLRASRFDGRGLIASLTGARGDGEGTKRDPAGAFRITAEVGQMAGFNGVSVSDLSLAMSVSSGVVRSLALSGRTGASGAFTINVEPAGDIRQATGRIDDTGALLRFANLYERMRGGAGLLSVEMADNDRWSGKFRVRRLAITEDPAIRALARTTVPGERDPRRRQVLEASERSGEAAFSALDLTFVRDGQQLVITEGTLAGATVGGTVSGTVDLARKTLDLTGTFVPAFALNNLFAKIPILGYALGGGTDEGLIGVTYKVTGAIGDPVLTVNPASAIAPGIFRKLFEYR